jgi:FKBP-type peptidyl-prolyl cis-trans isomerase FkpA
MRNQTIGLMLALATLTACDQNKISVTESGLKYQFFDRNESGRKPKEGEVMTYHFVLKNFKDSTLIDTYQMQQPMKRPLQMPPFKGSFEEGLAMMAKGDSAQFLVSADSLIKVGALQPMPNLFPAGTDLKISVRMLEIQTMEEFQKGMESAREQQKGTDAKSITDYLAKNNIKAQKTESGLHYVITQPGSGATVAAGDSVQVRYVGKLLDGKVFDQNTTEGLTYPAGQGFLIPGWEEGVMKMRQGDKATIYIPSYLAYGEQGSPGAIPPNSVLVFDLELVRVKKNRGGR